VALAVADVVKEKNKVFLISGAATSDLTGKACTPNNVHWTYDTWMLAHGTGTAIVKQGGDTWFFITADYAFGHQLEADTSEVIKANGGKVLGAARAPLNTADFSSFLLQAQASKAKVIGLANAGGDTINSIKQASEFGIVKGGQKLAGLLVFSSDVNALGLNIAQGLTLTETWYWDANDTNRAWTKRWHEAGGAASKVPTMIHAGVYSGITHYLKAAVELKGKLDDGKTVVAQMKKMQVDDPLFGKGTIDANGRNRHPAYLFEVKSPAESKYPGDFYKLKATISAKDAFRDPKDSGCPLVGS
jgi:branched-chain amino acid transport system substrate-binding protein